jgi:hypothetical protein
MKKTLQERFDSKWEPDANGCWLWTGYLTPDGYGRFQLDRSSRVAHRVGYEIYVGPISEGLELDHLCRVRHCVNPEHLEAVTHDENLRRGEIGTYNAVKTHCKRGHALTGGNLYPKDGRRHCRACRTLASRRARAKRVSTP